jgi:hypothetical protein
MAWRSSFGATALLALVVLHLSMLIEPASSDAVQLDKDRVTPTAEKVRSMLHGILGLEIKVRDRLWKHMGSKFIDTMFDLWQADETKCSDKFFKLAYEWSIHWTMDMKRKLKTLEMTCFSRLEGTIQSELEAMKESTREQFKLFAEQDRSEFRPGHCSECLLFDHLSMINRLRRVAGSPKDTDVDELRAAERFVSACKEITASDSIKRTNFEGFTPLWKEPYFAHIRFYDFCRRLPDLERLVGMARSMFKGMLGSEIDVPNVVVDHPYFKTIFDWWQADETNCSEEFFDLVRKWAGHWTNDMWKALKTWKKTCYSRIEGTIQSELEAMKESTREQFKLFVEQDQAECRSEGSSECRSFFSPNMTINKLRRVIGSPKDTDVDELRAAERFVSACKEMTASDSIKRSNYKKWTPRSTEPYFPHTRFYDFCRRLLDFESLAQKFIYDFRLRDNFIHFGEKLEQIQKRRRSKADPEAEWGETAESGRERERSVIGAVAQAVEQLSKTRIPSVLDIADDGESTRRLEGQLRSLRSSCLWVLDHVDNLYWMHQHMYRLMGLEGSDQQMLDRVDNLNWMHRYMYRLMVLKGSDQQVLEIKRYLRYSEACKQLGKVKDEEIIETVEKRKRGKFTTCFGRDND